MMRPSQTMESMYLDMMERRSVLNRKESLAYQFTGEDRYMVLYYNQQRDAAFAKAKLPPFGAFTSTSETCSIHDTSVELCMQGYMARGL